MFLYVFFLLIGQKNMVSQDIYNFLLKIILLVSFIINL